MRIITLWFVSIILPISLFSMFYSQDLWVERSINSYILSGFCYAISLYFVNGLLNFPGNHSVLLFLPSMLTFYGIFVALFEFLNIHYSFKFIFIQFLFSITISYFDFILRKERKQDLTIHYIPFGRSDDIHNITHVNWKKLIKPTSIENIKTLVVDLHSKELNDEWQNFIAQKTLEGVNVYNVRQIKESLTGRIKITHMYENDLGSLQPSKLYISVKHFVDTLLIILTLPITLPIMLITSILIKLDDGGKIIYTQDRIGYRGKTFKIYKFRTMSEGTNTNITTLNDSRITRLGKYLRKSRIDELPQFLNVLKGEMSLIGPRAEYKNFAMELEKQVPFFQYRHIVKPGISGWAQVIQGYATGAEETQIKLEHDFYYIKHFSFTLDLLIFFKTIQTIFSGFGSR